ncbi:MAG: hypothetical protein AAFO69_17770, partial [Bacteroidota bacterium]
PPSTSTTDYTLSLHDASDLLNQNMKTGGASKKATINQKTTSPKPSPFLKIAQLLNLTLKYPTRMTINNKRYALFINTVAENTAHPIKYRTSNTATKTVRNNRILMARCFMSW